MLEKLASKVARAWVTTAGAGSAQVDGLTRGSRSFAPMSMVTGLTWPRCWRIKVRAAVSCGPAYGYFLKRAKGQPPVIKVAAVSPEKAMLISKKVPRGGGGEKVDPPRGCREKGPGEP